MKQINLALVVSVVTMASATLLAQGTPSLPVTDFSGRWGELVHEDSYERSGGPPLGDYQGIPLNAAGVYKADSHDHSEWSLPEFQCRPHSARLARYASGASLIPWAATCARFTSSICARSIV